MDNVTFEVREPDPKVDLGPINGKCLLRIWHHQDRNTKFANSEFLTDDQLRDLRDKLNAHLGDK